MRVFRPWLKPAVNRSFQAAEAWEGAARAITTAAQTAASAAVVRGTYPAPSFRPGHGAGPAVPRSRGEGPIYRVLTAVSQTPGRRRAQCGWKPGGGGEQSRSIIAWSFSKARW